MAEEYRKSSTRDTFESLVVTVILAIFGTTFVLQAFKIPTGSMENTLLVGDHLLVNKFAFAYQPGWLSHVLPYREPARGNVLVFKFPGADEERQEPGEHFVKRIIGVPGDRIRVVNRQVFVNGQPLVEPYVHHTAEGLERAGDNFPPYEPSIPDSNAEMRWSENIQNYIKDGELVVPPGNYFAMGDNRENSWDGRFWGFVPRELVSGRPLLIYWSFETPHDELTQTTLFERLEQIFDVIIHFPTKTRWRRTFNIVR
ncbi:MAG TPA: signal peptidase I [Terriglobia bacterium]|nr:signal peptidase I [Terriglobia bacterium]